MSDDLRIGDRFSIPRREFSFTFVRSSGPGGQNVNKVNTKAVLRWPVTTSPSLPEDVRHRFLQRYRRRIAGDGALVLTSQRYRDQGRNVGDCLEKVAAMLGAVAVAPRKRKATRPGRAAREARLRAKRARAEKKQRRQRPRLDD